MASELGGSFVVVEGGSAVSICPIPVLMKLAEVEVTVGQDLFADFCLV